MEDRVEMKRRFLHSNLQIAWKAVCVIVTTCSTETLVLKKMKKSVPMGTSTTSHLVGLTCHYDVMDDSL